MNNFYYECGNGWLPLIIDAHMIIDKYNMEHMDEPDSLLEFTQIKEKLGGLCLYMNYNISEIDNQIEELENLSFEICENCGTFDNVTTNNTHGYIMTLCDNCREKELKKYNKILKMDNNFVFEDMNNHDDDRKGWICPKCGRVISPDYKTCPYCQTVYTDENLTNGQQMICD